jgi:DHA2 family multidrug resistance protein
MAGLVIGQRYRYGIVTVNNTTGMITVTRPGLVSRPSLSPAPLSAEPPSLVEYGLRRTIVVTGVVLAALLQTVDATIVNVALPTIQGNLGATVDEGTWVVTAYVIANVVVIPMTPWLQLRFGRKNYFLVSILGFTIASVLCGLATTLPMLILFRIVQGAFGGGLLSTAQLILRDTFPPERLGTSQSIFALGTVLGPSIGPTLGGIITDNMSWAWVFDINVAPGIFSFVLLALYLRDHRKPQRTAVDAAGIALLIVTIGTLQYVLDQGQHDDWFSDQRITICAWTAALGAIAFVLWELRQQSPIVDLRVLRYRSVAAASLCSVVVAIVIFDVLLLLPQFTVDVLGFTTTLAGLLIGVRALPVALLSLPIGRLVNGNAIDPRYLITGGLFVAGIGTVMLSAVVTTGTDFGNFVVPLTLMGLGISFVYSPLLVATLRSVAPADGPKAAAFVVLFVQLGGSIASASLVALVDRSLQFHQTVLASGVTLANPAVQSLLATHHGKSALARLAGMVAAQAGTLAYADAIRIAGIIGIAMSPLALLIAKRKSV